MGWLFWPVAFFAALLVVMLAWLAAQRNDDIRLSEVGPNECIEVELGTEFSSFSRDVLEADLERGVVSSSDERVADLSIVDMDGGVYVARDKSTRLCLDRDDVASRDAIDAIIAGKTCIAPEGGTAEIDGTRSASSASCRVLLRAQTVATNWCRASSRPDAAQARPRGVGALTTFLYLKIITFL